MSDPRDQSDDPLESALRTWFRAAGTPVAPPSLHTALARLGADTRSRSRVQLAVSAWRTTSSGRLAAVASVLTVVVVTVAFLLVIDQHGPAGPTGSQGAVPSLSPSPGPVASHPTVTPAAPSPIDDGGIFGTGGLWAVAGDQLYLSSDYGTTWVQRTLQSSLALDVDVLSGVFVLDTSHVWTASPGPGSTVPYSGQGPGYDHLYVVVSRTTDGGVTWQSVTIPDDWGGTQPVLAFADAQHGFLLLSGLRGGGRSVVFATTDGGARWQRVGGADSLGSIFSASDAATLWAGNEGDAGPVGRPILDVSRDGGRTWADARLPGLVGDIYVNDNPVAPPVFSGQDGAVGVIAGSTDNPPDIRFYRTSDGGASWLLAARTPLNQDGSDSVAVIDPTHFVVIDPQAGVMKTTSDGGATWQQSASSGLSAAMRVRFWDARNGAAIVQTTNGPAPAAGVLRTTDGGQSWTPVLISPQGPSTTEVPSPAPLPSAGGTCSASQFVLGTATYAYGFGALGTTVVFVTQPLRNTGGSCVLDLPGMIGVASATGPFHSVPMLNAGTATSWKIKSGQSFSIVIGASWWIGVRDENGNVVHSAPPCADPINDVTRVEFPVASGSIRIDLPTIWNEVCSSPASVSLTVTK
jgi:photosystem II stability/assembly factor-like uncharacterized protein